MIFFLWYNWTRLCNGHNIGDIEAKALQKPDEESAQAQPQSTPRIRKHNHSPTG